MTKPKEYWVNESTGCCNHNEDLTHNGYALHMIEKSYADQLEQRIQKLEARVEKLRAVLEHLSRDENVHYSTALDALKQDKEDAK